MRKDRRGAVMPMAAAGIIMLFLLTGLIIDVATILATKHRLRQSLDSTGLAIAAHLKNNVPTQTELEALALKFLQSNYPDRKIGEFLDFSVSWDGEVAEMSAKGTADTLFLGSLLGMNELVAEMTVRVVAETRGLEVALALDNSGSMNGTEISWLRKSVFDFIETLYANSSNPTSIKVGMVPFVAAVNVKDPTEFANNWVSSSNPDDVLYMDDSTLTDPPAVSYHGENFNPRTSHAFLFKQFSVAQNGLSAKWYDTWKGCVEARTAVLSGEELDVTDEPPDPTVPETLWVPYFWPDDPDNVIASSTDKDNGMILVTSDDTLPQLNSNGNPEGNNNYMNDLLDLASLGTDPILVYLQSLESLDRYLDMTNVNQGLNKFDETPNITRGPNKSCPDPIVPLTNNRTYLTGDTGLLKSGYLSNWNEGGTAIAQGLVWAWRVLSPAAPFTQGVPYVNADGSPNKTTLKVIVLFIDGENGITREFNPVYSSYSAYGFIKPGGRLDPPPPMGSNDLNSKTQKVCANARAPAPGQDLEKLEIYVIAYDISSTDPVMDFLRDCTGNADRVFSASTTTELNAVFVSLAEKLTRLRVDY